MPWPLLHVGLTPNAIIAVTQRFTSCEGSRCKYNALLHEDGTFHDTAKTAVMEARTATASAGTYE